MGSEPPGSGYFFEHLLTREAAYRALLGRNRQMLHGMAADGLIALLKPGTAEEWSLLPHLIEHLALAGRHMEAHRRCCDLLYLAAGSGQHEVFAHYEREAEAQLLLAVPEAGPEQTSPALEEARGERIYLRFDYVPARAALERARELAETAGDKLTLARALRRLSALDLHSGELERAVERAQRSLGLAEELHDQAGVSAACSLLGMLHMRGLRHYAAAEQFFLRALEEARLAGSLRAESVALNNYGILLNENLGRMQEAAQCWEQSLATNRAMDNRIGEAITADNLGGLYLELGRLEEAAALLRISIQRYGETGDTPGTGSAGTKLGMTLLRQGDLAGARRELEAGLSILEPLDEDFWRGYGFSYMGSLCLAEGDTQAAAQWFARSRELGRGVDEPQLLLEAAQGLAQCALTCGRLDDAARELDAATAAAESGGSHSGMAGILLLRARLHLAEAVLQQDGNNAAAARSRAAAALDQAEQIMAGLALPTEAAAMRELAKLRAELDTAA